MKLHKTLTDLGATKNKGGYTLSQYLLQTKTGLVYISLDKKHLTCNFFGSEEKAKVKFGHWKQNTFVETEQDIINHINRLKG